MLSSALSELQRKTDMLIKILIIVGVVLIVLAVFVAMRPSEFRIARSAMMAAPVSVVFEQVNDFHNWAAWSPWEKLDPGLKRTYEGAPAGPGANYTWNGNKKVGQGRMTLSDSRLNDLIRITIQFIRPFAATNIAEFTFKPAGDQTAVTWSMTGRNNFFLKAFGLFMNMDKMVGGDFEKGLAQMKALVEQSPRPA